MQQPPGRCKRVLGHLGHFIPHAFVVIELLLLFSEVDELLRGEEGRQLLQHQWTLVISALAVGGVVAVTCFFFHERHCDICAYYRRHPRYSPLLFTLGRPWWGLDGAAWPGMAAAFLALGVALWIDWVAILHYLMMVGYWLGYIAYLRIGAGRVGEGQPRPIETL